MCHCCIHISCLRVASPTAVLQSISPCHSKIKQVSSFLNIFKMKCRGHLKSWVPQTPAENLLRQENLRLAPFSSFKPPTLTSLCMGKEHGLITVMLQESTRLFQQGLVYCTRLRPQILCLAIIQSYLHTQDPSLFHLPGSSHVEQKQPVVEKRQDQWVEVGIKHRLSQLQNITDSPGASGDPQHWVSPQKLSKPSTSWHETTTLKILQLPL